MKDEMPDRIWTVQEYYQAKEFYEKRGLIFNPALERGSPAAYHVVAQDQLHAHSGQQSSPGTDGITPNSPKTWTSQKTVLELDLVGYSAIADLLENGMDVTTVARLNDQIQSFVDVGLQKVGAQRPETVMKTTGDGAILVFDKPADAHRFAEAVHLATRKHNAAKSQSVGKRVFRMGAATGELIMKPTRTGYDIAGSIITRAVRLQASANPGGILVDPDTYDALTADQKTRYASLETVAGKRDETFAAFRCQMNTDGICNAS